MLGGGLVTAMVLVVGRPGSLRLQGPRGVSAPGEPLAVLAVLSPLGECAHEAPRQEQVLQNG